MSSVEITMRNNRTLKFQDKWILCLYQLYFLLKPFYFWSSGLPQISDFIMCFLMLNILLIKNFKLNFPQRLKRFLLIGLCFVIYVTLINFIWVLILNDIDKFIITSIFYSYNFIIVIFMISLYTIYKEKFIQITYKAILLSVFLQIIIYFFSGGFSGSRMTMGFNNPNQLGYYALLSLSIMIVCSKRTEVQIKYLFLGVLSSLILVFASLSKAAILSYIGLITTFAFFRNKRITHKIKIIVLIIAIFVGINYILLNTEIIHNSQLLISVQNRINSIGRDSDDNLDARGYNRIKDHPEYWVFGAGEGALSRFSHMEFHSTIGNIQVSYGIIGLALFLYFLYLALKNNKYEDWYILLMLMIYGLTHNGSRNSLFWILLVLISYSPLKSCRN